MNTILKKSLFVIAGSALIYTASSNFNLTANAEDIKLTTEYADLWNGNISLKKGDTVKWYVNVPEGTEPKGCGATIKIPDLGFGTDSHNKEEGHITLVQGENFIYEFTADEVEDILFTCWMGSGCHHNYIHVTDDGTYNTAKPDDPTDISAERNGTKVSVSFTAPESPEGARITGYKVTATDENGKRKKVIAKESPAIFEGLDDNQSYTFKVITQATSGDSSGENEFVLDAVAESETETETNTPEDNKLVTEYEDLWTGNITVKAGVLVKWYVNVPEGTDPKGCGATIKIPGLGFGTDSHNKEEGHISLVNGENFIYEFTPEEVGDILFTCWMGSQCHYNYIHVTADGVPDPNAKTGGRGMTMPSAETNSESTSITTTVTTTTTTVSNTTSAASTKAADSKNPDSPKTGVSGVGTEELILGISSLVGLLTARLKKKSSK